MRFQQTQFNRKFYIIYHQYQLIKNGAIAIGRISGEDGIYQGSDHPVMRDFIYTFTLPHGKTIKSSTHTFTLDKVGWKKPNYPVTTEIIYYLNNLRSTGSNQTFQLLHQISFTDI